MKEDMHINSMINYADEKIMYFQKKIKEYDKVVDISNKMLKMQGYIILIMPIFGFLYGGFTNMDDFMNSALYNSYVSLISTIPPVITAILCFGLGKSHYKDKIKELEHEIAVLNTAKISYEKELTNQKENIISNDKKTKRIIKCNDYMSSDMNAVIDKDDVKKLTLKKRK